MDHSVDVAVQPQEQAELGLVASLALDQADLLDEYLPRIAHGLLEARRDTALHRIDLEDLHFHLCEVETILPGCTFFTEVRHLGDVDQPLDAEARAPRTRRSR